MDSSTSRNTTVDIAKGMGIFLVIVGHCVYFGEFLHNWIFSFHMPFFFILSGLFFTEVTFSDLMRKKSARLLKPYLWFCAMGFVLSLLLPDWRRYVNFHNLFLDIYLGNPVFLNVSSIWFLMCLFLTMLMLRMVLINKWTELVLLPSLVIIGFAFERFATHLGHLLPQGRLPLNLDCACVALLFLYLGYKFKHQIFTLIEHLTLMQIWQRIILSMLVLGLTVGLTRLNGRVNLHGMTYNNVFFYLASAISGSLFIMLLASLASVSRSATRLLCWLGKNTILILGAQAIGTRLFIFMVNRTEPKPVYLYFLPEQYVLPATVFTTLFSVGTVLLFNYCVRDEA